MFFSQVNSWLVRNTIHVEHQDPGHEHKWNDTINYARCYARCLIVENFLLTVQDISAF